MCKVNASKDARTATAPFVGTAFSLVLHYHQFIILSKTTASYTTVGIK